MEEGEEEVLGLLDKVLEDEDVFEDDGDPDLPCSPSAFKVRMNEKALSLLFLLLLDYRQCSLWV